MLIPKKCTIIPKNIRIFDSTKKILLEILVISEKNSTFAAQNSADYADLRLSRMRNQAFYG
jgi:hypothetical protein